MKAAAADDVDRAGDSVRAVERALDILLAFGDAPQGCTAAELLQRVDLSRPTLYRLLNALQIKGFVASSGEPQRFRLGPSVARLAHSWTASVSLSEVAEPVMRRIWQATGETVALFVPEGLTRLCVAELPSPQPLSFRRGVGYRERLVLGASGRCILAQLGDGIDLQPYAAGTSVDIEACRRQLRKVRRAGYAVSRDELIQGAVAIAAPVFGAQGQVLGALAVFGPSVRLPEAQVRRWGVLLKEELAGLSAALGRVPA